MPPNCFFEILCYSKPPSGIYWHSPCKNRVHSSSENGYNTHIRKVCLNYLFCTMCNNMKTVVENKIARSNEMYHVVKGAVMSIGCIKKCILSVLKNSVFLFKL